MKRLVVQENDEFGWDVRDLGSGEELLYTGDRIRAEGFARQHSAGRGGTVTVVGRGGTPLAEYEVSAWARTAYPDPPSQGRFRRRG